MGNEIMFMGIPVDTILSLVGDGEGEEGNPQQCPYVYHHREVNSRILVVGEE